MVKIGGQIVQGPQLVQAALDCCTRSNSRKNSASTPLCQPPGWGGACCFRGLGPVGRGFSVTEVPVVGGFVAGGSVAKGFVAGELVFGGTVAGELVVGGFVDGELVVGGFVTGGLTVAGFSSVTVGLAVAGFSSVTVGLAVLGLSPNTVGSTTTGVSFATVGLIVVGLSVIEGFVGGCSVFDSFAPAIILSLCSWINLSKINSTAAARWGLSPEEESLMISRSEESSTKGLSFE